MPARIVPFITGYWYHIFNRGVDRSPVFRNGHDYQYFEEALTYYRYDDVPYRFSRYLDLSEAKKSECKQDLEGHMTHATVASFAFMPNHFHVLAKQESENGIHTWLFKALNSYSQYFNKKRNRVGPVCQGNFQAVRIETDEQFLHVSRYIHINPVVAGMVSMKILGSYPWTSYPVYLGKQSSFVDPSEILGVIGSPKSYMQFVEDQVGYAQSLPDIRHMYIDCHLGGGGKGEELDGPICRQAGPHFSNKKIKE